MVSLASASPPPSPTKSTTTTTLLSQLITTGAVQRVNTQTWESRWKRTAAAPPPPASSRSSGDSEKGVKRLVKAYEADSLSRSRGYEQFSSVKTSSTSSNGLSTSYDRPALLPPITTSRFNPVVPHTQLPSSPSPTRPGRTTTSASGNGGGSPTKVPASFFQQQQAKRTPPASPIGTGGGRVMVSRVEEQGKENIGRREGVAPLSFGGEYTFSARKKEETASVRSEGSTTTVGTTGTSTTGTTGTWWSGAEEMSLNTAESAERAIVKRGERIVLGKREQEGEGTKMEVLLSPAKREVGEKSRFTEEMDRSLGRFGERGARGLGMSGSGEREGELPREGIMFPSSARREEIPGGKETGGRRRAKTLTAVGGVNRSPDLIDLAMQGRGAEESPVGNGGVESPLERERRVEREFEKLLDTLQPTQTVRTKMQGLTLHLKEEMIRSSPTTATSASFPSPSLSLPRSSHSNRSNRHSRNLTTTSIPPSTPGTSSSSSSSFASSSNRHSTGSKLYSFLRRTKSSTNLVDDLKSDSQEEQAYSFPSPTLSLPLDNRSSSRVETGGKKQQQRPSHSRSRSASSSIAIFKSLGRSTAKNGNGIGNGVEVEGGGGGGDRDDPSWWAVRIRSATCVGAKGTELGVKEMGVLRTRLRNELPSWVGEFVKSGGYVGLLEKLKELLDVEWREEQHDDQMLHELLRCLKALTLTSSGKRALSSRSPTPFIALASLLFSEKRPGDLPCRQVLVELLLSLFLLSPAGAQAVTAEEWNQSINLTDAAQEAEMNSPVVGAEAVGGGVRRYIRKMKGGEEEEEEDQERAEERKRGTFELVWSLMKGPPDVEEGRKVEFIRLSHKSREMKIWVGEVSDIARDYFWMFAHAKNHFWALEKVDEQAMEAPSVPSGMTGGVEHEAMSYCTAHFKLLNALISSAPSPETAFAIHKSLFESGFEPVLLTLRRASFAYYPTLHLELARYVALARSVNFNLGPQLIELLERDTLKPGELGVLRKWEEIKNQRKAERGAETGAPRLEMNFD